MSRPNQSPPRMNEEIPPMKAKTTILPARVATVDAPGPDKGTHTPRRPQDQRAVPLRGHAHAVELKPPATAPSGAPLWTAAVLCRSSTEVTTSTSPQLDFSHQDFRFSAFRFWPSALRPPRFTDPADCARLSCPVRLDPVPRPSDGRGWPEGPGEGNWEKTRCNRCVAKRKPGKVERSTLNVEASVH
jgi:hypothetical protein